VGWAVGGVLFGFLTDKIGRSKTMIITILTYSLSTAAGAFAINIWMLALLRFLSSLGVGGEYSSGTTLVAESMPERYRVVAGVILYCAGPLGTFLAFGVYEIFGVVFLEQLNNSYGLAWRLIFASALVPAILSLLMRVAIKEPERWKKNTMTATTTATTTTETVTETAVTVNSTVTPSAEQQADSSNEAVVATANDEQTDAAATATIDNVKQEVKEETSIKVLFRRDMIKSTAGALVLVVTALISWYCITSFISPVAQYLATQSAPNDPHVQKKLMDQYVVIASVTFNFGGLVGSLLILLFNKFFSRVNIFRIYFLLSSVFIAITFLPIPVIPNYLRLAMFGPMGLFVYGIFAMFPFYLPEIFPTNVRGIGIGFSYNSGRLITAIFPFLIGWLVKLKLNLLILIMLLSIVSLFGFIFSFFRLVKETKHIELDQVK